MDWGLFGKHYIFFEEFSWLVLPFSINHPACCSFPFTNDFFGSDIQAFWDKDKTTNIIAISDPVTATGYTPVGVDFFSIRERGEQFGPFGAQYPVQLYNQTGRGYFRCSDEAPLVDPSIANNSAPVGRK